MERLGRKKASRKKGNKIEYYRKPPEVSRKELEDEAELESMLFGDSEITEKLGTEEAGEQENYGGEPEDDEDEAEDDAEVEQEEGKLGKRKRIEEQADELRPVWEDEDDKDIQVNLDGRRLRKLRKKEGEDFITGDEYEKRLRARFESLSSASGGPSWAKLPDDEEEKDSDEDEETELLQSTTALVGERSKKELSQDGVFLTRCKDANQREPSKAVIQSVNFHKNGQLLLTAGFDKTLRLFQIDGKINPKVQSYYFEDTPIHKAFFTPDGKEVIVSGRRKWFHVYDVMTGKITNVPGFIGREEKSLEHSFISPDSKYLAFLGTDGNIILASNQTKQWIANLKMNAGTRGLAFLNNSNHVSTTSDQGLVYQWDLRTYRCFNVFEDEGKSKSTSIAVDSNDQYHVIGSESGVVNIYETASLTTRTPKPKKSLMNFSVAVNVAKFNPDAQILALGCRGQRDRFKLVHAASATVFPNWPTAKTPLGYVSDIDFSPQGGYLAIGNSKGRALLYRVNSYDSA